MDKKILTKTIISCVIGAILWCLVDLIICAVRKESFVDTFLTPYNLFEVVLASVAAGFAYYSAQKKKNTK